MKTRLRDLTVRVTLVLLGSWCAGLAAQSLRAPLLGPADCVPFSSATLLQGMPFTASLPRQLRLRLEPERGGRGWHIVVNPEGTNDDYVWPVSPPYQTAPHLKIGQGYGLTARESVSFTRDLRFVATPEDYAVAVAVAAERPADVEKQLKLGALVKGSLTIRFTGFSEREPVVRPDGFREEVLDWIAFEGTACVAR